ncbi:argininosuccinate lyase [Candidatus Vidania fulgoroideorum]
MIKWSSRFKKPIKKIVLEYTNSILIDKKLFYIDIQCTKIHCKMLCKIGIINNYELTNILNIIKNIKNNNWNLNLEDIHLNIEKKIISYIGEIGNKIRTARSRNDQIATDVKIWIRKKMNYLKIKLLNFIKNLINLANFNLNLIIPGFTHLQIAQPVYLSHHLLAYFEMFYRDLKKISFFAKNFNDSPLGSCALAGSNFKINRFYTAKKLGFDKPCRNSIDGVSNRDFILDFLYINSLIMFHISRFSEELILWLSSFFGFVDISDDFCTGSSIMPQKKNPDILELSRAKSSIIISNLFSMFNLLKSLPLAYNKDYQEDKRIIFYSFNITQKTILILIKLINNLYFKNKNINNIIEKNFSYSTDIADYLTSFNIPFKLAHDIISKIVKICIIKNKTFKNLNKNYFSNILNKKNYLKFKRLLNIFHSVNSKISYGGTNLKLVKKQINKSYLKIKCFLKK